jgi:hypothetical protein
MDFSAIPVTSQSGFVPDVVGEHGSLRFAAFAEDTCCSVYVDPKVVVNVFNRATHNRVGLAICSRRGSAARKCTD